MPARGQEAPGGEDEGAVLESVRAGGLLDRGESILVMLSGGRDSVCLTDLAVRLRGAARVRAVHVNYRLRPESDLDQEHCGDLCASLGIELSVVRAPAPDPGNLQAWARDLRYRAAGRIAATMPRAVLAAGHTATDQVETILYRLAASPGRRALLGMPAVDGSLVRPLLDVTREQTAAYCTARGLRWREDPTNDSDRYARGRVRAGLLPALRAVHPAAERSILRTARLLREEAELLEGLVDEQLRGRDEIEIARLERMPAPLARLVLIRLAEDAAGTFVPQAGARCEELLALARRGGRAELHVGGSIGAVIEDGLLRMVRLPPRAR